MGKLFAVIILFLFTGIANGDELRTDGNFFNSLTEPMKTAYVGGLIHGISLGASFALWASLKPGDGLVEKIEKVATINSYSEKYINEKPVSQFRDGLKDFYADFKNRRIDINDALWVVAREIKGDPDSEIKELISNLRRDAK